MRLLLVMRYRSVKRLSAVGAWAVNVFVVTIVKVRSRLHITHLTFLRLPIRFTAACQKVAQRSNTKCKNANAACRNSNNCFRAKLCGFVYTIICTLCTWALLIQDLRSWSLLPSVPYGVLAPIKSFISSLSTPI